MITNLARPPPPRLHQHITQLLLLKQFQHPFPKPIEILRQSSQVHTLGIGFQSVHYAGGESGGEIEGDEGFGGGGAGGGDGEHFGEPEGEVDACAGF
jgi:hypothetical protein